MRQTPDFDSFFEAYKSSVLNKQVDKLMELYDEDLVAYDIGADGPTPEPPLGAK
jgi:hypothetical protein